jgi:hypothetical protein
MGWSMMSFLALLLAGAQPQVPSTFSYVLIEGRKSSPERHLQPLMARAVPNGRRADLPAAPLTACSRRGLSDHQQRCIRALVPDAPGARMVALSIEEEFVSNVTGSVVHQRDTIRCIGPRSTGRIELGTELARARQERIVADLPACIAAALSGAGEWGGGIADPAAPLWRFPLQDDQLAADAQQARGRGSERALIEIDEAITTHRARGQCSLRGRIIFSEATRYLRTGDMVEVASPCRWDGPEKASRMFTQGGLFAGQIARIYVSYRDGALEYVEPL